VPACVTPCILPHFSLPSPCPVGTGDCFPGVKRPERKADHSPPPSAEAKKVWRSTPAPNDVVISKHKDSFTLRLFQVLVTVLVCVMFHCTTDSFVYVLIILDVRCLNTANS
jgi:hypothetical protein